MIAEINVNHSFSLKQDINTKSSIEDEIVAVDESRGHFSPSDPRNGKYENSDNYNEEEGTKKTVVVVDNGSAICRSKDDFFIGTRQQYRYINATADNGQKETESTTIVAVLI